MAKVSAIANKVRNEEELAAIHQFCETIGLPVAFVIPFDPQVTEADLHGQAIMDYAADSKAVRAIETWAGKVFLN